MLRKCSRKNLFIFRGLESPKTQRMKIYHLIGEPYSDRTKIYAIYDGQSAYYSHSLPSGSSFTTITGLDPTQAFINERKRIHRKFTNTNSFQASFPISSIGTMAVWILIL